MVLVRRATVHQKWRFQATAETETVGYEIEGEGYCRFGLKNPLLVQAFVPGQNGDVERTNVRTYEHTDVQTYTDVRMYERTDVRT